MLSSLIMLLVVLAAFALVWWGVSQLSLPQPVKVVVLVIMGLIGLAFVYHLVTGSGLVP